jgi:hypothetical protein
MLNIKYHDENDVYFTEVAGFVPSLASRYELGQGDGMSKVTQLMAEAGYRINYPPPNKRLNAIIGYGQNVDLIVQNAQPPVFR